MGAELTYEHLSGNTYRFTLTFYRDCTGESAPLTPYITLMSQSCGFTQTLTLSQVGTAEEVSAICDAMASQSSCNGGYLPGVEKYIYRATATLPPNCGDWRFSYQLCCRNNMITNSLSPQSYNIYVEATYDNSGNVINNSPVFTSEPVTTICVNEPFNYNFGAVDPDGDSLAFTLIAPKHDLLNDVPYASGFNAQYPVACVNNSFQFDGHTGQMSCIPSTQQVAIIAVRIDEYRHGQLIGSSIRDMQIVVINCNNQQPQAGEVEPLSGCGKLGSRRVQGCPGSTITFRIPCFDPDSQRVTVFSNIATAIPGATLTTSVQNGQTIANIQWQTNPSDTGIYRFVLTVQDSACPVPAVQSFNYEIVLKNRTEAGEDTVYCGTPVQLNGYGGSVFNWSPSAGLSGTTIPNPLASPAVPTTYILTTDCGVDSVFVNTGTAFTVDAGNDKTICLNGAVLLDAVVSPPGAYRYKWTPSAGLSEDSVLQPIAGPSVTTTYELRTVSDAGCRSTDQVTVIVSGNGPRVNVTSSPVQICPGEPVELHATVQQTPVTCGIYPPGCNGQETSYVIGNGSLTGNAVQYPAPFGNYYWAARHQMLYRASELAAAGMNAGTIKQLALNVAQINGTSNFQNFTIRLGCTSSSELTGWEQGTVPVYARASQQITTGWNTFTLDQQWNWDSQSNIIVEICFTNNSYTANNPVYYTQTPFNSVVYFRNDNVNVCSSQNVTGISNKRPNVRFTLCENQAGGNYTYAWNPDNIIEDPDSSTTKAYPLTTTTFLVSVDDGQGCIGSDYVTVEVDQGFVVDAGRDTALCVPATVQLNGKVFDNGNQSVTCGLSTSPAQGTSHDVTLGNGSGLLNSSTAYPAIFGNFYKGARHQILYRAGELVNSGMQAGTISRIAFHIGSINGTTTYNNFSIKIGCTSNNQLTNWEQGLETVINPRTVQVSHGWNVFTLDNNYNWDGQSNLIVEVCFFNNNYTANSPNYFTVTPYPSVVYYRADNQSVCNSQAITQTSDKRPDIRFTVHDVAPPQLSVSWAPATGLDNPFVLNPWANPQQTTTYVLTAQRGTCVATDSVTITIGGNLQLTASITDIQCAGAQDAAIQLTVGGGTPPYAFSWSNGMTTGTISALAPGNYTVTVTDAAGCSASGSYQVHEPMPLQMSLTSSDVTTVNGNDGSILVQVSGGAGGVQYLWSDGATVQNRTGLQAGTYCVTAIDANQCSVTGCATVNAPGCQNFQVRDSVHAPACGNPAGGWIGVSARGGTPPYAFHWSNGMADSVLHSLSAGSYTVTISDAAGCTVTRRFTLNAPGQPVVNGVVQHETCPGFHDGTISITVQNGVAPYLYNWSNGSTDKDLTAVSAGLYSLTVTDAAGCTATYSATIQPASPIRISAATIDPSCYGSNDGEIELQVTGSVGPYDFQWSDGNTSMIRNGLAAGTYICTITDANGCSTTFTDTLTQPRAVRITGTVGHPKCHGDQDGFIDATLLGGMPPFTYQWSTGDTSEDLTGLAAGTYSLTVTDNHQCSASWTFRVNQPQPLTYGSTAVPETTPGSGDGSLTIQPAGGTYPYSYLWSTGATTNIIQNLSAGNYCFTLTDAFGCTLTDCISLTGPTCTNLTVEIDTTGVDCSTGERTLIANVSGGLLPYRYQWHDGATTQSYRFPGGGVYQLTVSDADNCSTSASGSVRAVLPLTVSGTVKDVSCGYAKDGQIDLLVSGGKPPYLFQWSNGWTGEDAVNLPPGAFDVTVTDNGGCTVTRHFTVNAAPGLEINSIAVPASCHDSPDGQIWVQVSGGNPPYEYQWSNGASTAHVQSLYPGIYRLTVTDGGGCLSMHIDTVHSPEPLAVRVDKSPPGCGSGSDGYIELHPSGGTSPYTYNWRNGATTESLYGIEGGTYLVTVSDSKGCERVQIIQLDAFTPVEINLGRDDTIRQGESLMISPVISNPGIIASYFWNTTVGMDCWSCISSEVSPLQTTTYILTVIDTNGCTYSDSITVYVDFASGVEMSASGKIFIPSAFTPNNDGINDYFLVRGDGIIDGTMKVYNRWGQLVYVTDDIRKGWDGMQNGQPVSPGVFVYLVKLNVQSGREKVLTGNVTLMR